MLVQTGRPLLDRSSVHAAVLNRWLARWAAHGNREGDTVAFLVRNEDGSLPDTANCRLATAAELRGKFRRELAELQETLKNAKPQTPTEIDLHRIASIHLQEQIGRLNAGEPNGAFFRYQDEKNRPRLIWCWGYQPTASPAVAAVVCPDPGCRLLARLGSEPGPTCLRCGRELRPKSSLSRWAAVLTMLMLLVGAGLLVATRDWPALLGRKPAAPAAEKAPDQPAVQKAPSVARDVPKAPPAPSVAHDVPKAPPAPSIPTAPPPPPVVRKVDGGKKESPAPPPAATVLAGQVMDAISKAPVAGAKIAAVGTSQQAETDAAGRFRLDGLRSGKMDLEAAAPGYAAQRIALELKDGAETSVNVELKGAAFLAGQVFDAGSRGPIAGAKIAVVGTSQTAETDPAGRFRLDGLRSGKVEFDAAAAGYVTQRITRELKDSGESGVEVSLTAHRGAGRAGIRRRLEGPGRRREDRRGGHFADRRDRPGRAIPPRRPAERQSRVRRHGPRLRHATHRRN